MKTQRIVKNMGKVEFLANLEEVKLMIAQGYNYKNIYSKMVEEKRFTMSYYTFCHHLRALKAGMAKKSPSAPPQRGNGDRFIKPTEIEFTELV